MTGAPFASGAELCAGFAGPFVAGGWGTGVASADFPFLALAAMLLDVGKQKARIMDIDAGVDGPTIAKGGRVPIGIGGGVVGR